MTAVWSASCRASLPSPANRASIRKRVTQRLVGKKGKVERAIGYVRQSFWPLREFTDLHDVNRQVRQWLAEIANQRLQRETRERPMDRFKAEALRPLPVIPYDHRDSVDTLAYKDLRRLL